jgi:hypothetical protein
MILFFFLVQSTLHQVLLFHLHRRTKRTEQKVKNFLLSMRKSRVLIQSKNGAERTECAMHARARVGYSEQVHKRVSAYKSHSFRPTGKSTQLERGKRRRKGWVWVTKKTKKGEWEEDGRDWFSAREQKKEKVTKNLHFFFYASGMRWEYCVGYFAHQPRSF